MAGKRPHFQAPFPCEQTWEASTYNGHWPNQNSIDLARRDRNGKNISKGEPVLASADGIVSDVITTSDGGKRIYIDHGDGWMTHYIHHEEIPPVSVGQFVARGEKIGETSNTGARAVHIHYTQLRDGRAVRSHFDGKAIDTHAGNPESIGSWGTDRAEDITSQNCSRQGSRYMGVFRQESGEAGAHALWLHDTRRGFTEKWRELGRQNLRLIDLKIVTFGSKKRYSGVFREGTGRYALWLDDTRDGFVDKWKELSGKGLRLINLEISGEGRARRYSGVFRQGSGRHALWLDDTRDGFVDKWRDLSGKGLRLIDIEVSGEGSGRRYSGVFRQGSGRHALWLDANWRGFTRKWKELSDKGLRLIDLELSDVGGQRLYSGVFRQGTGGYRLWNSHYSRFMNKWMEWSKRGLRLIDLEIVE
jgi:hypothetical protein